MRRVPLDAVVRNSTHEDAKARLEAIRDGIAAEAAVIAAASWWDSIVAGERNITTTASDSQRCGSP